MKPRSFSAIFITTILVITLLISCGPQEKIKDYWLTLTSIPLYTNPSKVTVVTQLPPSTVLEEIEKEKTGSLEMIYVRVKLDGNYLYGFVDVGKLQKLNVLTYKNDKVLYLSKASIINSTTFYKEEKAIAVKTNIVKTNIVGGKAVVTVENQWNIKVLDWKEASFPIGEGNLVYILPIPGMDYTSDKSLIHRIYIPQDLPSRYGYIYKWSSAGATILEGYVPAILKENAILYTSPTDTKSIGILSAPYFLYVKEEELSSLRAKIYYRGLQKDCYIEPHTLSINPYDVSLYKDYTELVEKVKGITNKLFSFSEVNQDFSNTLKELTTYLTQISMQLTNSPSAYHASSDLQSLLFKNYNNMASSIIKEIEDKYGITIQEKKKEEENREEEEYEEEEYEDGE